MNDSMSGRVAIVSGATAGIGQATTSALIQAGAKVVINGRRKERLDALVERFGSDNLTPVPGDAAEQAVIDRMLEACSERFGQNADAVVVNAGRGLKGSLFDSDPEQWAEVVQTNLLGTARLMRAAAQRMVDSVPSPNVGEDWLSRPRDIVVLGSVAGKHISPFSSMYGSTKFAVGSLAEALRRDLAAHGVRVTLIEPAVVESEFQAGAGYDPKTFGEFMDRIGPVLTPDDIARTILFSLTQPAGVHISNIVVRPTRQEYP